MIVDRSTEVLILILVVVVVACCYLVAWRGGRSSIRRFASLVLACILALFGWIGTVWYALPALNDFHNTHVPLSLAIVGNLVLWAICIGAWVVVVRCAWFALRKNHPGV
jgi:hypothetical protein